MLDGGKKSMRKAVVAVRKEFRGKAELDAIIPLTKEVLEAHPILKEKGFEFAEIIRRGKKLNVKFV